MATYWVRADGNGDDANNGESYALALHSLAKGLGMLDTGDTLNVVNDGTHLMLTFAEANATTQGLIDGDLRCRGTAWNAPGCVVQGVNSSGTPAVATIAATTTDTRRYGLCQVRDRVAFMTVQGIKFDWSAYTASTTILIGVSGFGNGAVPMRMYDCEMVGSAVGGATPGAERQLLAKSGGGDYTTLTDGWEVAYCVFTNCPGALRHFDNLWQPWGVYRNVFIWDTNNAAATPNPHQIIAESGATYQTWAVTHNTFYLREMGPSQELTPPITSNTTNATNLTVHSNLLYIEVAADGTANAPFSTSIFDSATAAGSGTRGVHGYNVIACGTNVAVPAAWGASTAYYDTVHNPDFPSNDNTAVYTTDLVTHNATHLGVFNATGAWTWTNPRGTGYSHTLPYDLRPAIGRATGQGSSVAGAVLDPIILPVTPGTDNPEADEARAYIDSYPFYRPLIKATIQTMVRVKRNRVANHVDFRHYLKEHVHDESTHRISSVAASEAVTFTLGGVDRAAGVLLATNGDLSVTVTFYNGTTNDTFTTAVSEVMLLDQCDVRQLNVTNTSATTATVELVVFD